MRKAILHATFGLCVLFVFMLMLHLCSSMEWTLPLLITCGTFLYHFSMRLAVGYLLPQRFTGKGGWFQQKKWEPRLYEKLKVQAWKKFMPSYTPEIFDLGKRSLHEIIASMCHAEMVHEVIILLSFLPLLAAIPFGEFPVFLITSIFAALIDTLFVILQRYNRPRLIELRNRRESRAKQYKTEE